VVHESEAGFLVLFIDIDKSVEFVRCAFYSVFDCTYSCFQKFRSQSVSHDISINLAEYGDCFNSQTEIMADMKCEGCVKSVCTQLEPLQMHALLIQNCTCCVGPRLRGFL